MNSVYTIVSGGPPYQVGPYTPGRWPYFFCGLHLFPSPICDIVGDVLIKASRYALRASRSVVVSLRLSRRYAASESAKKAVARGSWFVKAHHHSEWAVVKYHSGPPFGTAPTSYEPRTTNNKKALAVVHLSSRIQDISVWLYTFTSSGHEIRHKRLTRFCASQGSFTYHALRVHHISGGPPFGTAPTSYEPLTTNNKKSTSIS